jgi:hypothetical protein
MQNFLEKYLSISLLSYEIMLTLGQKKGAETAEIYLYAFIIVKVKSMMLSNYFCYKAIAEFEFIFI